MNVLDEARAIALCYELGSSVDVEAGEHPGDKSFTEACAFLDMERKEQERQAKIYRRIRQVRYHGGILAAYMMLVMGLHWLLATALVGTIMLIDIVDPRDGA